MPVFEPLGGVRGQKLHRIVHAARKRNRAPRLAKIIEVLKKFRRAPGLGNRLLVPLFHKLQKRAHQVRPLQIEVPDHNLHRLVRASPVLPDFAVNALHAFQHRWTARELSQHRAKIEVLPPHGSHRRPQLHWINAELGQRRHAKKLGGIVGRHSGGQASHYVANLWRVEHVQTFDGEWNAPLGKFMHQFIAMVVLPIEHSKIAPPAALVVILILVLAFPLDSAGKIGSLDFFMLQVTISTSGAAAASLCFASSSRSDSSGVRR